MQCPGDWKRRQMKSSWILFHVAAGVPDLCTWVLQPISGVAKYHNHGQIVLLLIFFMHSIITHIRSCYAVNFATHIIVILYF